MATWLITGANRGIGLEMTRQAARAGHFVLAAARHPETASELAKLVKAGGVQAVALDVADPASFVTAKHAVGERAIDVLVNNAGVMGPKRQSPFDMDYEGFSRTLAVNVFGPLRATQTFLPNLERAAGAKIAAITSSMGSISQGGAYQVAYSASKAALNRLMRALAVELKTRGIAVGIYSPGWARTDMGGPRATLPVEDSVAGLIARIAELDLARSGQFINWDGKPLPW